MPKLEIVTKVLFGFLPDQQFGHLITVSLHSLTILKSTNAEFLFIELWFTDQNNRLFEIEGSVNIILIIGNKLKMRYLTRPREKQCYK